MSDYQMTENIMLKQEIGCDVEMTARDVDHIQNKATLGAEEEGGQQQEENHTTNKTVPMPTARGSRFLFNLMDLARDHRTTPSEFLLKAQICPNELSITDVFKPLTRFKSSSHESDLSEKSGNGEGNDSPTSGNSFDTTNKELITSRITPNMGNVLRAAREKAKAAAAAAAINFFDTGNNKETHLNPLHIFLGHAKGISKRFVEEIDKLDGACFTRLSSLNRTPLHHFMERNKHIDARCLVGFYRCDPQAFLRLDLHRLIQALII